MGMFMKEHDIYVGTMLDSLNLRFAPTHNAAEHHGGINEMAALQKEFGIFKEGRSFRTSVTALHLGSSANHVAKNGFYKYLDTFSRMKSNIAGQTADEAVVKAIAANLAAKTPLPVYFDYHQMGDKGESKGVIVKTKGRPLSYMDIDYLWISMPMKAWSDGSKRAKAGGKGGKGGKKK